MHWPQLMKMLCPFMKAFSQHLLGDHYSAVAHLGVSIGCFIQNCLTEKGIKDLNTGLSQLQAHCLTAIKIALSNFPTSNSKRCDCLL